MAKKPSGPRVISSTTAAKNFGKLIDQVRSERAEYVVERSGAPVARIAPVGTARCTGADLVAWLRTHTRPDESYLEAVEAGIKFLNRPSVPENRWER